ncbi:MAG: putative DNA binding domain-containing protein [Lachnospiraceae bacterium]|nr:putative DNA binding domain-containing protein [Lachnospiraceae bacterium]
MIIREIKMGESKNIEFKVELPNDKEKYLKTIIAFANGSGGKLIIGVDDERNIVGINKKAVYKIMDKIANVVSDSCEPQIAPNITVQEIDGNHIIIVEVYPSPSRPYYIRSKGKRDGVYIRTGGTTRLADSTKIRELELEGSNQSWDEQTCIGYKLLDDEVNQLCEDIYFHMMESVSTEEEKTKIKKPNKANLINWKVLKEVDGNVTATNAFALLVSDYFQFAEIQCALFKGTNRDVFIDKKEYSGAIYNQIEEAYQFVLRHINRSSEIESIVRKDFYELPIGAIREMIINAVVHRDYMDNSKVQVAIYDDRVEVTSPGTLFGGLTLSDALSGRSKIRNKVVANVFNEMEIMESWGSGLKRIMERAEEFGLQEPAFVEMDGSFRVNLFRNVVENKIGFETASKAAPKSGIVPKTAPKSGIVPKTALYNETELESVLATIINDNNKMKIMALTGLQRKILAYIVMNPSMTRVEIGDKVKKSRTTVRMNISTLRDAGLIEFIGSSKSGKWIIK